MSTSSSTPQHVLLVTWSEDRVADHVVAALRDRGAVPVRLDTDRFPAETTLVLEDGADGCSYRLVDGEQEVELSTVEAVWYRRFYATKLPDDVDPRYARHSKIEARTFLDGLFRTLHRARWVDPIARVRRASHKLLQLEVAREVGLEVPDTLMTNDPAAVRRFFDAHGGHIVTKLLSSFAIENNQVEYVVYTSPFREPDFEDIDGLRICPMVFQEEIEKAVELRVTVVGDQLFVASVDASRFDRAKVDWRRAAYDVAVEFVPDELPPEVSASVLELMRAFGLVYGALDIIRTPEGRHVFLEINPAGEWEWIQRTVGHPIAASLADVLTGAVKVDRPWPGS